MQIKVHWAILNQEQDSWKEASLCNKKCTNWQIIFYEKESLPFNLPTIQSAAIKAKRTLAALNVIDDIFKLICKMATLQNDGFMFF